MLNSALSIIGNLAPFIWHLGMAGILMAICGLLAFQLPMFRALFIILILIVLAAVGFYIAGVSNEHSLCTAQKNAMQRQFAQELAKARRAPAPCVHLFPFPGWGDCSN